MHRRRLAANLTRLAECRKPLSGAELRGVLLFFSWVSLRLARSAQATTTGSAVAAADWNSFCQSVEALGASLASKTTSAAKIVTRATESFGTADGDLRQTRAKSPATNAIFYTRSKWAPIGRLWRFTVIRPFWRQASARIDRSLASQCSVCSRDISR